MSATLKKVILILLLFLAALYVVLPSEIPLKISYKSINIDKVKSPGINIEKGKLSIHEDFDTD